MRAVAVALLACAALVACGDGDPASRPAPAETITADPAGPARATMVMVHAGGWAGHDAHAQQLLMDSPGELLLRRGWRVVSIDYREGAAGLDDVLATVRAEIERRTSDGPLCLYGESSGAHLALVAAARVGDEIACVVGVGTPADLPRYEATAASGSRDQQIVARQVRRFFGTTRAQLASWDPVSLAPRIGARVLLLREADDGAIPAEQAERFAAAHRATRSVTLDAGGAPFLHGTLSARGRATYDAQIAAFAARARRG